MKQTAVEWLLEELLNRDWYHLSESIKNEIIHQAKEMEINQHNETWDVAHQAGRFEGKGIAEENWQTFQTHWEETYKPE